MMEKDWDPPRVDERKEVDKVVDREKENDQESYVIVGEDGSVNDKREGSICTRTADPIVTDRAEFPGS